MRDNKNTASENAIDNLVDYLNQESNKSQLLQNEKLTKQKILDIANYIQVYFPYENLEEYEKRDLYSIFDSQKISNDLVEKIKLVALNMDEPTKANIKKFGKKFASINKFSRIFNKDKIPKNVNEISNELVSSYFSREINHTKVISEMANSVLSTLTEAEKVSLEKLGPRMNEIFAEEKKALQSFKDEDKKLDKILNRYSIIKDLAFMVGDIIWECLIGKIQKWSINKTNKKYEKKRKAIKGSIDSKIKAMVNLSEEDKKLLEKIESKVKDYSIQTKASNSVNNKFRLRFEKNVQHFSIGAIVEKMTYQEKYKIKQEPSANHDNRTV